jgi:hypothetical protein
MWTALTISRRSIALLALALFAGWGAHARAEDSAPGSRLIVYTVGVPKFRAPWSVLRLQVNGQEVGRFGKETRVEVPVPAGTHVVAIVQSKTAVALRKQTCRAGESTYLRLRWLGETKSGFFDATIRSGFLLEEVAPEEAQAEAASISAPSRSSTAPPARR